MFRFTIRDVLWLTVVVAVALVAFAVRSNRPTRWEYRIDYEDHTNSLNTIGDEGWELVTVATLPHGGGLAFYFKRRK